MKDTLAIAFPVVVLLSVLFSSCSTSESTSVNSARKNITDHKIYNAAAVGYDNDRQDGPDTFGNRLVEFRAATCLRKFCRSEDVKLASCPTVKCDGQAWHELEQ